MPDLTPSDAPAGGVIPPPVVLVRRKFSWRDFFIGIVTGIMVFIGGMSLLVVGVATYASKMMGDTASAVALPAPDVPTQSMRSVYGLADTTWTFTTLAGAPVTLSNYRGKVVFVNFWATWCGPCIEEMPSIETLQTQMKNDDVAFVLVSDESVTTIQQFLARKKSTLAPFRTDAARPVLFKAEGIPATFIVDRNGAVVFKQIGMAGWDQPAAATFLRALLAEKADAPTAR